MKIICAQCSKKTDKFIGVINRAKKQCAPLFCNRTCAGLHRRKNLTAEQKKEAKRLYDEKYRNENKKLLKKKKAEFYKKNHDREREKEKRRLRAPQHAEYCRQPEYKKWKKQYDRQFRAKKFFGEFNEAFCVLLELEDEILTRVTRYEIYQTNGTLNKHLQRRRDYEKLISNKS